MRISVSAALIKRVQRLERQQAEKANRPIGLWPPILNIDVWEEQAMEQQAALAAAAQEDCPPDQEE